MLCIAMLDEYLKLKKQVLSANANLFIIYIHLYPSDFSVHLVKTSLLLLGFQTPHEAVGLQASAFAKTEPTNFKQRWNGETCRAPHLLSPEKKGAERGWKGLKGVETIFFWKNPWNSCWILFWESKYWKTNTDLGRKQRFTCSSLSNHCGLNTQQQCFKIQPCFRLSLNGQRDSPKKERKQAKGNPSNHQRQILNRIPSSGRPGMARNTLIPEWLQGVVNIGDIYT